MKRVLIISLTLLIFNLLYSSYALKIAKNYTNKLIQLKIMREQVMVLTARIENIKKRALKEAKTNIDWGRIIFREKPKSNNK